MALDSKKILFYRIELQTGEVTLIRLLSGELTTILVCASVAKLSRLFTIKYLQPEIVHDSLETIGYVMKSSTFQAVTVEPLPRKQKSPNYQSGITKESLPPLYLLNINSLLPESCGIKSQLARVESSHTCTVTASTTGLIAKIKMTLKYSLNALIVIKAKIGINSEYL